MDPSLAEEIIRYREQLGTSNWNLDIKTLVTVLAYRLTNSAVLANFKEYIISVRRSNSIEQERRKIRDEWGKAKRGVEYAKVLLGSELGIRNSRYLPSEPAFRTLATVYSYMERGVINPRKIAYWFVLASIHRRYTGATEYRMTEDIKKFIEVLRNNDEDHAIKVLVDNIERQIGRIEISEEDFIRNDKFTRSLLYLALHENNARDPEQGTRISDLSVTDFHHIF